MQIEKTEEGGVVINVWVNNNEVYIVKGDERSLVALELTKEDKGILAEFLGKEFLK